MGFNVSTPVFDGAHEEDIMDTLDLANDYVNLEWEEFKAKHEEELLPEVMDYLYENRDHRKLWKGVPISPGWKGAFKRRPYRRVFRQSRNHRTHALSEAPSSGR